MTTAITLWTGMAVLAIGLFGITRARTPDGAMLGMCVISLGTILLVAALFLALS